MTVSESLSKGIPSVTPVRTGPSMSGSQGRQGDSKRPSVDAAPPSLVFGSTVPSVSLTQGVRTKTRCSPV